MCGIFGITLTKESDIRAKLLQSTTKDLFKLSESRGKEASGLSLLYDNKIKVLKRPMPASDLIASQDYKNIFSELSNTDLKKSLTLIGHTRLVTNGSLDGYNNNQPIIKDGLVGIHNGIVVNDNKLWQDFPDLHRQYEVDTEIILSLIRMHLKQGQSLIEALKKVFKVVRGTVSTAILFEDIGHLLLSSNNGSLYVCFNEAKSVIIFASERRILEELINKKEISNILGKYHIRQIKPQSGYLIDLNNLDTKKFFLNKSADNIADIKISDKQKFEILDLKNKQEIQSDFLSQTKTDINALINSQATYLSQVNQAVGNLQRCTRCILPSTMPFIKFDDQGVCNYCHNYKKIKILDKDLLNKEVAKYKSKKNNKPDCLVPLSGGRDSSFGLHYIKNELKMNPVAFSYDWGMITDLARRNQARMCGQLGVEHILISADLRKKRNNIRKNVQAWLKKPDLGTIPLFMAGDKQYFYYINKLKKQLNTDLIVYSENSLEKTDFKSGFCGVKPKFDIDHVYDFALFDKAKLLFYYLWQYASNPAYINSSLLDSLGAYISSYFMSHEYFYLFRYIRWDEEEINNILINQYDWEVATDTDNTWRIGDGTAPFYNYIYYTVAGFTENDTFRSNQIREGVITRDEALRLVNRDNQPRYESMKWYCDTININLEDTIKIINKIPKLYKI